METKPGAGVARRDGGVAAPRVIGSVGTDFADGLVGGDLVLQFGQHRRISNPATGNLDGPDLERVGIDTKMHFPPLPRPGRPVFLGEPLTFTLSLDPGAVDQ